MAVAPIVATPGAADANSYNTVTELDTSGETNWYAWDVERVYALVCRRQRWPETGPTMRAVAVLRDAGLIVRPRPPARPGAWVPADAPAPPAPKAPPRPKKAKPEPPKMT